MSEMVWQLVEERKEKLREALRLACVSQLEGWRELLALFKENAHKFETHHFVQSVLRTSWFIIGPGGTRVNLSTGELFGLDEDLLDLARKDGLKNLDPRVHIAMWQRLAASI